jgi:hypothetical protein
MYIKINIYIRLPLLSLKWDNKDLEVILLVEIMYIDTYVYTHI